MVELQLDVRAALAAPATVSCPDELLHVVGDGATRRRHWLLLHRDHRLSPVDALLVSLIARDQEGVDLFGGEAVVFLVPAILEQPIRTLANLAEAHGVPDGRVEHVLVVVAMDLGEGRIHPGADVQHDRPLLGEQAGLVADGDVLDSTQHCPLPSPTQTGTLREELYGKRINGTP